MAPKRRGAQRKEDEVKLQEVLKTPVVPFDQQVDLTIRQQLVYEQRRRGLSPAEIAIELGTTEPSVRETLSLVSERFLVELDDMRRTFTATNISRLEYVISKLMPLVPDRDATANLLKALKLEDQIFRDNSAPPQQGNTTNNLNVFIPTLNAKSKLYQETIPQMNPEAVQHYHPDVYARHKDIIENPAVKRLENLLPVESDDESE